MVMGVSSFGQKKASFIKMKKGVLYSEKKRTPLMDVMSLPDGKYLQLRYKSSLFSKAKELKMEILNNSLSIIKENLLQFQYQGKNIDFESYIQSNDKLYVFTSYKNKEKKIKYLFGQIIDLNNLSVEMPMKKLMELGFDNHSSANSGSFNIVCDKNVENILLHAELPYSKNEPEKYQIVMVDKNLEQKWKLDRKMSYKDRSVSVMGWVVDNAGNAFLTFEVKGSKKVPIPESEEGIYVSAITQNGTVDNTTRMDLKFGEINSLYYIAAEDGKLLITGFYAEKRTEIAAGIFYGRYDVNLGDFELINSKKFSLDFITNNFTENQAKKTQKKAEKGKEVGLKNYTVDEVIRRDDGGATIIAEMYYMYIST